MRGIEEEGEYFEERIGVYMSFLDDEDKREYLEDLSCKIYKEKKEMNKG